MYVVLAEGSEGTWVFVGEFVATDARSAIRVASKESTDGGRYVAVPKRSWQPVSVKIETRQVVLWGDENGSPIPEAEGDHVAVPSAF